MVIATQWMKEWSLIAHFEATKTPPLILALANNNWVSFKREVVGFIRVYTFPLTLKELHTTILFFLDNCKTDLRDHLKES